jgi:hypothetical protein
MKDDKIGWSDTGSSLIWETREDRAGLTPVAKGPDTEISEIKEDMAGWTVLGSAEAWEIREVKTGPTLSLTLALAVTEAAIPDAWDRILPSTGCAVAGSSVIWACSEDRAGFMLVASGSAIADKREVTAGCMDPGNLLASESKDDRAGCRLTVADEAMADACETISASTGCTDVGKSVTRAAKEDNTGSTPVARGSATAAKRDETAGWTDAGSCVASEAKEDKIGSTLTVADAAISEACDRMLDRIGWAVMGSSVIWETNEDNAGSTPVAMGSAICDKSEETAGCIDCGNCVISETKEFRVGWTPSVAEAAILEACWSMLDRTGCAEAGSPVTCDANDERATLTFVAIGSPTWARRDETAGCMVAGNWVTSETRDDRSGVANAAMLEACPKMLERMGWAETGNSVICDANEESAGLMFVIAGSAICEIKDETRGWTDVGNLVTSETKLEIAGVADLAMSEACPKILESIGWAEIGNSVICAFSEDKAGSTLITRGLPICDKSEDTAGWIVAGNWPTSEAREDRLIPLVAEAAIPDTRERSEERTGSIPVALTWAPKEPLAPTEAPTPCTSEMMEDSAGWSDAGSWVIWAAKELNAGCSAVAEAPRSDTWSRREETAGFAAPVSTGSAPETPESNEVIPGWILEAEAPISETWLKSEESAGWMADAAGFANRDVRPGSTAAGKVGTITAFPTVLTALVASAKIDDTAEINGAPVMLASTPVACENNWDRTGCKDTWTLLGRSEAPDRSDEIAWTGSIDTAGEGTALAALVAASRSDETDETKLGSIAAPEAAAPETCEIREAIAGCTEVWMSPGNWVASERRLEIAWRGATVTDGSALTPPAASVAALRIDESPEIKVGSTTSVAATALDTSATREAMAGCIEVWISLGNRVAPDRSCDTAGSGSTDKSPPAALVASASADERLEIKFGSMAPVAAALLTWETKEAITGWTEVWISPGNCVASESRLVITWRGSAVIAGVESASPAADVASDKTTERLETRPASTTPVEAATLIWDTREDTIGCTELWISTGSWVAWPSSEETAWTGSTVTAGVDRDSPATDVALSRIDERLETRAGSTAPVAAASLTCEIKDDMSGWIEVCIAGGSCVAWPSNEEMAWIGSTVTAGVDSASPAANVASERIDERPATKVGSTEPVAAAAVTCETMDDMAGASEVWISPGSCVPCESREETAWIGSAATKAVGSIDSSPGRPVATFRIDEIAFVTRGSTVPVADASKPDATLSREDRAGFTLLCTSPGKPDTSDRIEEIAEMGSAVTGLATREVSSGIPVASTRMDESAELAPRSPIVAEASICVATDNSEERAGCKLLSTSAGKLEAAENKDESAGTGSAVTGLLTRDASSGIPVTSTRTEDMSEVATGSTTLVATFDASPNKEESAGTAVAWTSAGRFDAAKSRDEMIETGSTVTVGTGKPEVRSAMTFVVCGRRDVSAPRTWVVGSGSNCVSPPRIWVLGTGSKVVRSPRTWLVGAGKSDVKSPITCELGWGSNEVSPPKAWVSGAGKIEVRAPRISLVGEEPPMVAPKLALRLGSAKSDEIADTASWGISVCVGLLINEESTEMAVGTESAACELTSESTEDTAGRNETPVGDIIKDDKTALADVGRALSEIRDAIAETTFAGASVATGAWIKDDKLDTAKAASPETWFPAADTIEEIAGKMFDWLGAASKDDSATLAEVGRPPPLSNEDIDGKAPWGISVCMGTCIKELNTDTAEVTAPVARLPMTEIAEFTPGKIDVSTGTASKVVEGTKDTCDACSTTEDTTPATEDASAVLLTAISEMTELTEGSKESWVGSARIWDRTEDADVGRVPSPSNDEMAEIGAPVAIGIAMRVVEGIKIIVADGMLVTPASSSEIAEEAALGKIEFWARDDNANEACGKIVACVGAASIELTSDIALLGSSVFEITRLDKIDPIDPLGTCTAAVGAVILVRLPTFETPASSSETADDAAPGTPGFWANEDKIDEACGRTVAWLDTPRMDEMSDTALSGRPVFDATRDDKTDPAAPLGTDMTAAGVAMLGESPPLVTPPSNCDTADEAALGKAEFCASDDNINEASGKIVACVGAAKIDETRDRAALGRLVSVLRATSDERTLLATPVGTDTMAVALVILLPIIAVGMRAASALSRPVAATCRHRTSVHVVRTPFVPLTMIGAIKVVSLAAAAPCAKDRVARSLDPRTEVGKRATLTPSRLVAATFKQITSEHVVVVRPLEAVIVIGWARLVAVGAPAKLAPRASEPMLLLPSSVVGRAPTLLRPNREVAAVCRQNTSTHVVVAEPSVAVITTGSARPVWDGTISVPRSFPSTEVGINPAFIPSKEEAASWTHIMSVHTVVVLPSVATTVTCSDSEVAVGAEVTPRERVLVMGTWVREAVGIRPKLALANPVTATLRQTRSVHVVWAPLVDMTTGLDSVLEAWTPPRPRDRPTRPPLDDGKAPTLSPRPPICALKQTRSVHVVVADVPAAELVDAAIAKDEMMDAAWPEIVAVPEVMSDAIEDNIELTLPGIAAALERTLAKDTKEDWGWLAITDTWEAREATALGSVLIELAVSSDAIAAVLELAPVTPLRASEMWKPRLVGKAVAADKTEFRDDTAWVLLVATGFARMLESRDATLEVWPSTTLAIEGTPEGAMLSEMPADTLTELRGSATDDEAILSDTPADTPADTLTELRGCVAEERIGTKVEERMGTEAEEIPGIEAEGIPGITAEETLETTAEDTRVAELAMDSTLLAELAMGNTALVDVRLVEAVVADAPEPPRPMDRRAELWAIPIPRFPRRVVPEVPPMRARFSRCSCSWSSVGELYEPAGAAMVVATRVVKEVTVMNRMARAVVRTTNQDKKSV